MSVTDCPLSRIGDPGVGLPAVSPGLTVTVEEDEDKLVSDVDALSVNLSFSAYVSPPVSVFAAMEQVSVAPAIASVPLFTVHWVVDT